MTPTAKALLDKLGEKIDKDVEISKRAKMLLDKFAQVEDGMSWKALDEDIYKGKDSSFTEIQRKIWVMEREHLKHFATLAAEEIDKFKKERDKDCFEDCDILKEAKVEIEKARKLNLEEDDLCFLCVYGLRYSMDRKSVAPSVVVDAIEKNWKFFSEAHKEVLVKELTRAIKETDDECNKGIFSSAWMRIRDKWKRKHQGEGK